MDTGLLKTFVVVARQGSFSAAAAELGYTQSAVSQQVALLERQIGARLLHRRPVAPTEAGQRLLTHAAPLLLRLDAAIADVARLSAGPPAHLSIGLSPLSGTRKIFAALAAARQSLPRVTLSLRVSGRHELLARLASGDLDLALVDGVTAANDPLNLLDAGPLTSTTVAQSPIAVALPVAHPLADRSSLSLHQIIDALWIDAPDIATPLAQLSALAHADRVRSALRYDGADVHTLLGLIASGSGIALLPTTACTGVAAVPLSAPRLVHRVELIHHSTLAPPATTLFTVDHELTSMFDGVS
ncbi:LysR family transcriptional regulator [Allorhizocola rhizosphaerae]|uniref:LysR family transcriptional regulator n=1 Tax=Allorhizocola rhizosphaerae TaxID=1872709 RepID=UPI001B8C1854|nr:LysR family transcriptional regulator [Allorhizocola rhizosphaerae]